MSPPSLLRRQWGSRWNQSGQVGSVSTGNVVLGPALGRVVGLVDQQAGEATVCLLVCGPPQPAQDGSFAPRAQC